MWKATDKTVAGESGETELAHWASLFLSPPSMVTSSIRDDAIPYLHLYRASLASISHFTLLLFLVYYLNLFSVCVNLQSSRCDRPAWGDPVSALTYGHLHTLAGFSNSSGVSNEEDLDRSIDFFLKQMSTKTCLATISMVFQLEPARSGIFIQIPVEDLNSDHAALGMYFVGFIPI